MDYYSSIYHYYNEYMSILKIRQYQEKLKDRVKTMDFYTYFFKRKEN